MATRKSAPKKGAPKKAEEAAPEPVTLKQAAESLVVLGTLLGDLVKVSQLSEPGTQALVQQANAHGNRAMAYLQQQGLDEAEG